ncbi:MAG: hypothetical protein ACRDY7_16380 [Acidimicrobiia bacterium]
MLVAFWSPKGGSGTSVVAAATALALARRQPCQLADLSGDQPAILGVPPEPSVGLGRWLEGGLAAPTEALDALALGVSPTLSLLPLGPPPTAPVAAEMGAALVASLRATPVVTLVDAGQAQAPHARGVVETADVSVMVVRGCYLTLRRAVRNPLTVTAAGLVLVDEPGRALGAEQVAEILERPVLARVAFRPAVARAVDAGVLACRLPAALDRPANQLAEALLRWPTLRAA